jgi:hypothetical protein
MTFDPYALALYTDAGELIKVLHCPLKKQWDELNETDAPHRTCWNCERAVLDTATMTEAEVVAAVRTDPHTCLCVSAAQENVALRTAPSTGNA